VRSVNWVLLIGIALFCLLFFGGLWILNRRQIFSGSQLGCGGDVSFGSDARHRQVLSKLISYCHEALAAQNVDVTAPSLRGGLPLGSFQMPAPIYHCSNHCLRRNFTIPATLHLGLIGSVTQNRA